MTLEELRVAIEDMVAEYGEDILGTTVMARYDYGDHCRTQALASFDAAMLVTPVKSAYSSSGLACPDLDQEDEINQIEDKIAFIQQRLKDDMVSENDKELLLEELESWQEELATLVRRRTPNKVIVLL